MVTGGAGFIGSNLIHAILQRTDHHVINLDKLTYAGNLDSLTDIENNPRYELVKLDIANSEAVASVFGKYKPDAVIHLAAESHVDRSIDAPAEFLQTNIVGTYNLLVSARSHWETLSSDKRERFRFHHVSTDEVYGSLDLEANAFTETTRYDPRSPYAATKASSDHLVRAWSNTYGLPILVSSSSNNYGPFQFPEKLIPHTILKAMHGEPIPVYGNGSNIRDWIFVDDHIDALLTVLNNGQPGKTYNVGGGNERSNLNVVKSVCKILDAILPISQNSFINTVPAQTSPDQDLRGADSMPAARDKTHPQGEAPTRKHFSQYEELIHFVPDRPGHDFRYAADTSLIREELGWSPTEAFESGLQKTVQWYLVNSSWWKPLLSSKYRLQRLGLSGQIGF